MAESRQIQHDISIVHRASGGAKYVEETWDITGHRETRFGTLEDPELTFEGVRERFPGIATDAAVALTHAFHTVRIQPGYSPTLRLIVDFLN